MGTTLLSIEFSTHTEILASPATASCSVAHRYRASYPSFVHWLSSTRTSEPFRLPAGYLAEAGSGRLKSQHKYRKGRFFDTNHETSPETSVTITLSHVVVYGHALRCCHGAVAPDVMLALEAGCCKHAVDFSFVCGRWQNCCFVAIVPSDPRGSLSLVVPACIRRLHFHKCVPYASAVSSTD